jgi:hypothetical protein
MPKFGTDAEMLFAEVKLIVTRFLAAQITAGRRVAGFFLRLYWRFTSKR